MHATSATVFRLRFGGWSQPKKKVGDGDGGGTADCTRHG
jgi:hypothetical protein